MLYNPRFLLAIPVVALLSLTALAFPYEKPEPQKRADNHTLNRERADAVKEAFTFAWDGYYKYAFPNDELHPVTNGFTNSRYVFP